MGHNHRHHHHSTQLSGKKMGFSILLNVLITVAQIIGGLVSGSISLLTDALHNFSDVFSLFISYGANKMAGRESTLKQTYGYRRAEVLAAFINSATLIGIAVFLAIKAVERIFEPKSIDSEIVIWLALGSIMVNFLCVFLLKGDAKENMNVRSAYLHLLSDALTSVAVMLGGFFMKFYQIFWVDSVLSLLIAAYLVYMSWNLLLQSTKVLMQFVPADINLEKISREVMKIEGIKNLHHIHIWQLDDRDVVFEGHIDLAENITIYEFEKKLELIDKVLRSNGINHCNIQPEYGRKDDKDLVVQH
ncbi:cation diffusion facilitator family transporter [Xanthovirga aplysinae]|uniref:cation diffusion facilitator family transporter n=1 Tax=Xanthovirga aplysinae TaxID=2529853 RepID=UPI0012BBE9FD|nr:cation diffusion facilitator family transporter [Xanthovirga aplysinae]MTI31225.1 cation transporter [Xanthovirga aplysinae]